MQQEAFNILHWKQQDHAQDPRIPVGPKQIGCWTRKSVTEGGAYEYNSTSGLHHYSQPQLPVNLNEGFPQQFIQKDPTERSPVELVITAAQQAGSTAPTAAATAAAGRNHWLQQASVVTFRNNLNKILGTLVNMGDGWTVDACMHSNTLYLDIVKTPEHDFKDKDLFNYYGYKFEAVCTAPAGGNAQGGSSTSSQVVDSSSEYATLVNLQLGPHSIIMAAEVDCMDSTSDMAGIPTDQGGPPPLHTYLELKTCKAAQNHRQEATAAATKWPKWWLQSFLAGIPTLVVGSRDSAGMLTQVERIDVRSLPTRARAHGAQWDAWQMLRFGAAALTWMRTLSAAHQGQHLQFTYNPASKSISCTVVEHGDLPSRLHAAVGP